MKMPSVKIYAAPVALLMMAGALATPTASADTAPAGYRMVTAAFQYNPQAAPEQIYAKLRRLAERMCAIPSPSPLSFRRIEMACVAGVMENGVSQIGRTDVAAVHDRANG